MPKLKWIIEISVDKRWIEDGFNLTRKRAKDIIEKALPCSWGSETDARILYAPPDNVIAKIQGYKSVKAFKADKR